jgi:hypothetical protein
VEDSDETSRGRSFAFSHERARNTVGLVDAPTSGGRGATLRDVNSFHSACTSCMKGHMPYVLGEE